MADALLADLVSIPAPQADAGPPFDTDASLKITERPVEFTGPGDATRLRGVLTLPAGGLSMGNSSLILVHGWGTSRMGPARLLVRMARRTALHGMAALNFDLPGRGESEGTYASADIDTMIDSVLLAGDWLRARGISRILLTGLCSGANIVLAAAALSPRNIAGVLAMSALPYQEARTGSMRLRRSLWQLAGYMKKACRFSTWRRLLKGEISVGGVGKAISARDEAVADGRNLKLSSRDIPAALAAYDGKMVFVWGEKDPEAGASGKYFQKLVGGGKNPAEIYTVAGANHNYYGLSAQADVFRALDAFVSGTGAGSARL
ncbi:MAG: alpha/beta fold hydrolase [Planctomycetes bacterium]|nr:alpha/beta fold hydrolase [Planctomycetota bacterium]